MVNPRFDRRTLSARRERLLQDERERFMDELEAQRLQLGPADFAALRRGVDDTLRVVAGTTLAEAGVAIAICDAISPLLLRAPDPRAKLIGSALMAACRLRRKVRRRT